MRDYKIFIVWERSHKLAVEVYNLTKSFPKEELSGLTSKLRRSAVAVPPTL